MDNIEINAALEGALIILYTAKSKMFVRGVLVNEPAWEKLYRAEGHLKAQQAELLSDALTDPEKVAA